MINWQRVEDHHRNCRAILDWLSDLMSRAIQEGNHKTATEAWEAMNLIYGMPRKGEK